MEYKTDPDNPNIQIVSSRELAMRRWPRNRNREGGFAEPLIYYNARLERNMRRDLAQDMIFQLTARIDGAHGVPGRVHNHTELIWMLRRFWESASGLSLDFESSVAVMEPGQGEAKLP